MPLKTPFRFIKTRYDANKAGYFGDFGGQYVPEVLMKPLQELELAYQAIQTDQVFIDELNALFETYAGRPTPLFYAENLSKAWGDGIELYIKFEGLNHTGAHKLNHCLGQALMAKRLGKKRIIAETGAGQHGLATATIAAKLGLPCTIYMGAIDYDRQRPNVFWMKQLGADVVAVEHGSKRLKDAVTATLQDWITHFEDTFYILGSTVGPHPFPSIVRDFQSIVGLETKEQIKAFGFELPDTMLACVGGGCNALGFFNPFLEEDAVELIGVEPGGSGIDKEGGHATRLQKNLKTGIVEGYKSYFIQNDEGQILPTHSISAGLDYAGIGPQHAYLFDQGRVSYGFVCDDAVKEAFSELARYEGVIGALESLHAIAYAKQLAKDALKSKGKRKKVLVNLSGRGDKDLFILAQSLGGSAWEQFLDSELQRLKGEAL